jgi:hypothetical protein
MVTLLAAEAEMDRLIDLHIYQHLIDIAQIEVSQGKNETMKTRAKNYYIAKRSTTKTERLHTRLQAFRHEAW